MIDYSKILQESKDKKYGALASKRENKPNPYTCNYCPGDHHKYCEHEHCILDESWIAKEVEVAKLRNQLRIEETYLRNGEGTVGYDFRKVFLNVERLKRKLKVLEEK
jgi:hypothetical protein